MELLSYAKIKCSSKTKSLAVSPVTDNLTNWTEEHNLSNWREEDNSSNLTEEDNLSKRTEEDNLQQLDKEDGRRSHLANCLYNFFIIEQP